MAADLAELAREAPRRRASGPAATGPGRVDGRDGLHGLACGGPPAALASDDPLQVGEQLAELEVAGGLDAQDRSRRGSATASIDPARLARGPPQSVAQAFAPLLHPLLDRLQERELLGGRSAGP